MGYSVQYERKSIENPCPGNEFLFLAPEKHPYTGTLRDHEAISNHFGVTQIAFANIVVVSFWGAKPMCSMRQLVVWQGQWV